MYKMLLTTQTQVDQHKWTQRLYVNTSFIGKSDDYVNYLMAGMLPLEL
jgi:hypothetical protein